MTDEPSHAEQEQETLQGIADYLMQENPELDKFQARNEALRISSTQCSQEALPPKE